MRTRTWAEVERALTQLLNAPGCGDEVPAMRGFLWRASQMVRDGHAEDPCADLYERLLCEHEERVFRAQGIHP